MSEQDNRRLLEQAYETINRRDMDAHVKLLDDSYVWENDAFPTPYKGQEGSRQAFNMYFAAFPDLRIELEQVITSGDHVVARWRATGTHKGEYKGVAPTNKQINVRGCNVHEIRNGKFTRTLGYSNELMLMQQLGVSLAKGAGR
jgi:steroid delta-isomerase-like uncharacterized protein